jgi:predicted GIY-YIG superfamily endonuclease
MPEPHPIFSYLLTPEMSTHRWRSSFVGITSNIVHRAHLHNGEIQGGAKATSSAKLQHWEALVVVHGFEDWDMLLQCTC